MAKIILTPNEYFEHVHHVESESKLIEGEIEFAIGKSIRKLSIGEVIKVPANTVHCMHNTGQTNAIIDCAHYPPTDMVE